MRRSELLKASPPMFESPWLDRFTRVHPIVPVRDLRCPRSCSCSRSASAAPASGTPSASSIGGYAVWTLTEYWLHRVVFHFEPERGIGARLHWMIHGVHHDHPNDPLRLVMPPSASLPLAHAVRARVLVVLGGAVVHAFTAGFLAGYLAYDMIHYHVHHHRPRTRVGRRLRELHMRHHFQDEERGFGVSAPTGTTSSAPRRRSAPVEPVHAARHAGGLSEHRTRQPERGRVEVVDGLPVPRGARAGRRSGPRGAGRRPSRRPRSRRPASWQAPRRPPWSRAAAAARARRRRKKSVARSARSSGSNSFLVDVHLVRRG